MKRKKLVPLTMVPVPRPPKKKARRTGDYNKGREVLRPPTEKLCFDVAANAQNFVLSGAANGFVLNALINGPELYQRTGRKIYMRSIRIRGYITNIATATQDFGRIVLVYDSQTNIANSLFNVVMLDANAGAVGVALSNPNMNFRARYRILRDQQFLLPSVTNTAGVLTNVGLLQPEGNSFVVDWFVKLKGLETEYNATNGGTIADITSGSIQLYICSESQANQYAFTFSSRLRYYC